MGASRRFSWLLRPAVAALAAVALVPAAAAGRPDPHAVALSALAGVEAAITAVNRAYPHTAEPYRLAARRALHALVPAALGHLAWLERRDAGQAWAGPVQAATAAVHAAIAPLSVAAKARDIGEFHREASQAMRSLLVAVGRPSLAGSPGGLRGALATTALGVPAGQRRVNGCVVPTATPAFGVVKGHLTYVAVPRQAGVRHLAKSLGVRGVLLRGNEAVLYTAAAGLLGQLCP